MGAPGKSRLGFWLALARTLAICAALIAPAAALAQSSGPTMTPPQQSAGQTVIRKSAPGTPPMEARETKDQGATLPPAAEWPTDVISLAVTVTEAAVTQA